MTANEGQQVDVALRILAIGSFPSFKFCCGSPKAIAPITEGAPRSFCWPLQARKGSTFSYQHVMCLVVEATLHVLVGWADHQVSVLGVPPSIIMLSRKMNPDFHMAKQINLSDIYSDRTAHHGFFERQDCHKFILQVLVKQQLYTQHHAWGKCIFFSYF